MEWDEICTHLDCGKFFNPELALAHLLKDDQVFINYRKYICPYGRQ